MNLCISTKYVCGIDLHARKMTICVMDCSGKIFLRKEISNILDDFLECIDKWRDDITIGVESTYNWYWLIDGLTVLKIQAYLGHAYYIKQASGLKHKTDSIDARHIADLLRTDRFPLAYAYPSQMRTVRDLLRRRHFLIRHRAGTYSHFKNTCTQQGYIETVKETEKKTTRRDFPKKVTHDEDVQKILTSDLDFVDAIDPIVNNLERYIIKKATMHNRKHFITLQSIPGCGNITALTVLYEMHTPDRFNSAQCFSSYCRVVRASNSSADKDYGRSSKDKIGNPYLKWALSEIAQHMVHQPTLIQSWYKKQVSLHGVGGAQARLRHKIAVTIYQMLKHNQTFDEYRFLGIEKSQEQQECHRPKASKQQKLEPVKKRRNSSVPAPSFKRNSIKKRTKITTTSRQIS